MKKLKQFMKGRIRWWKSLKPQMRQIISVLFVIFILISLIWMFAYSYFELSNDYIRTYDAEQLAKWEFNRGLLHSEDPLWFKLVLKFDYFIGLLIVMLGIAWIFHGAGFKIIG